MRKKTSNLMLVFIIGALASLRPSLIPKGPRKQAGEWMKAGTLCGTPSSLLRAVPSGLASHRGRTVL